MPGIPPEAAAQIPVFTGKSGDGGNRTHGGFPPKTSGRPDNPEPVEILIERLCAFRRKPTVDGRKQLGCARCGKAKAYRDHMGAPPSIRALGSGNQWVYQNLKQTWQTVITEELQKTLPRGLAHVAVEGECCFPDAGRRDQGNFRFFLEKATGDALTEGGWLEDDDWSRYEFGGLAYRYEKGRSYTRLMIFPTSASLEVAA